jgi:hypothetical protein
MNSIDIEDVITVICSEFLKQEKYLTSVNKWTGRIPYLKMNMSARNRVTRRIIDKFMKDQEKKLKKVEKVEKS